MSGIMPPPGPPQGLPPMAGGLLAPSAQTFPGPGPLPQIPGLMRPTGQEPGATQVIAQLLKAPRYEPEPEDHGDNLPESMRPYRAGLRPAARPDAAAWQQEIIYDKLGKTDQEIQAAARHYLKSADAYNTALSRERRTASRYYDGLMDEQLPEGRSQIVMTVVRDTVRQTLPSMLRLFTAVEDPVSFEPASAEITGNDQLATTLARQATDYCRWALMTANPGWQILHDCLLDALVRKAGWVRWHWGARKQTRTEVCEGLLLPQLQMLLSEPGIETQRIAAPCCRTR